MSIILTSDLFSGDQAIGVHYTDQLCSYPDLFVTNHICQLLQSQEWEVLYSTTPQKIHRLALAWQFKPHPVPVPETSVKQ
jgi:hypothetical protein